MDEETNPQPEEWKKPMEGGMPAEGEGAGTPAEGGDEPEMPDHEKRMGEEGQ